MVILTLSFKETLFYPLFVDNVHEIFIRICIYPYEPHRYSRHNRMAIPSPKPIKHLSNGADTDSQMCQMMRLLQCNYVSRLQLLISNARLEAERHSDRNWHGGNRLESTFLFHLLPTTQKVTLSVGLLVHYRCTITFMTDQLC